MSKSNDACNSLTLCNLPGPTGYPNYLARIDTNLQYLLSSSLPAYNNKIYKTKDGGNNWTLKLDTSGIYFSYLQFFDSLEGIAFSTFGKLIRTKNGGNNWIPSVKSLPTIITAITAYGDSTICLGGVQGSSGPIFISKDRGNTWPIGSGFKNGQPTGFFFLNKDTILGISSFGQSIPGYANSYFAKTVNGGQTWQNIAINNYSYLDIYFKSFKEGFIAGMNNLSEGVILKTVDLGQTWEIFNTHINTQLAQIKFLNDSIALVSGSNGVLFKWNSKRAVFASLPTGIEENNSVNLEVQIFLNPVKDKLALAFEESKQTIDKLSISNSLGQQIYTVDRPGNKKELDLSFLPAGIYYLKVENKEGQKMFKVVKE